MKKSIYLRKTTGERGVALFFALGILAVLIVTVLVFANRASSDLKVASAYASSSQARHFAESAMNRAMANISKNAAVSVNFYSFEVDGDNKNTFDWLWKLETDENSLGSNNPVRWQYIDNGESDSAKKQLIGRYAYFVSGMNLLNLNALLTHNDLCGGEKCNAGTNKLCSKHLGRSLAELTFNPERVKVYNGLNAEIAFNKTSLNNKTADDKILTYGSFDLLKGYWSIASAMPEKRIEDFFMVTDAVSQNEADAWFIGDIKNEAGNSTPDGIKNKSEFFHRFNLNRGTDAWKSMVVDGGGNYNINAVNNIYKDLGANNVNYAFYDNSGNVTENNSGILWFRNWNDTVGGWATPELKAKQIIANLINYNASKDTPVVSNVNPKEWNGTDTDKIPKYTGNKRTWYLNEALVNLNVQPVVDGPHQEKDSEGNVLYTYWKLSMTAKLTVAVEIINMYKDVYGTEPQIKLYGKVSFKYKKNSHNNGTAKDPVEESWEWDLEKAEHSGTPDFIIKSAPGGDGVDSNAYRAFILRDKDGDVDHLSKSLDLGQYGKTGDDKNLIYSDAIKLSDIKISELKIVLSHKKDAPAERENIDYAHVFNEKTGSYVAANGDPVDIFNLPFQVADARHNLLPVCWVEQAGATLYKKNSNVPATVSDNLDSENYAGDITGGKISTAYIRHGQMESLWELGAIHRAAPWQTINLKSNAAADDTNEITENLSEKGGGEYKNGDFRLFDQVSLQNLKDDGLGNKKPVTVDKFGKINLNAAESTVKRFTLDALCRGFLFHKDGTYDHEEADKPDNISVITASSDIDNIVKALGAPSKNGMPLFRRSDLYLLKTGSDFWKLFDGSLWPAGTLMNDANQEQLIGRIIQLTKASTNYDVARLTVIAQSIKDIDTGGTSVEFPVDLDEDGDVTDTPDSDTAKKNMGFWQYGKNQDASKTFNVSIPSLGKTVTAKNGKYDIGVDKITGTSIISAYMIYDNVTMKWKLLWVKHEE